MTSETSSAPAHDMKFEVVIIPVTDVERAKRFYTSLGWRLDADFSGENDFRVIQFTPPGSPCSIQFGKGMTTAAPGSARGMYLIVSDIEAARTELANRGVEMGEILHRTAPGSALLKGPHPEHRSYASFAWFSDPDGNTWQLQEVTTRLPGRVDAKETAFTSSTELAAALRRAAAAHGLHEKRIGGRDEQWPDWYAQYIVAEQLGKPLPA